MDKGDGVERLGVAPAPPPPPPLSLLGVGGKAEEEERTVKEREGGSEGEGVDLGVVEGVGAGDMDRGPNTVHTTTGVAGAYTMSPVCVAYTQHVPPTAVVFT